MGKKERIQARNRAIAERQSNKVVRPKGVPTETPNVVDAEQELRKLTSQISDKKKKF